jgi:DNA-binding transcriptional ArsR family regulator
MLDTILQALVEPRRREILHLLHDKELSAGEISTHFKITRPGVSQHLKVLVDAGLLTVRRHGTMRLYRLAPDGLAELKQFLEAFWDDHLFQLKQAAEAEARRRNRDHDTTPD